MTPPDYVQKQRRLDHYAAPFFSGIVGACGVIMWDAHLPTAIFCLASAFGYWTRFVYLIWLEVA